MLVLAMEFSRDERAEHTTPSDEVPRARRGTVAPSKRNRGSSGSTVEAETYDTHLTE